MNGDAYTLSKAAVDRTARAVRRSERIPPNGPPDAGGMAPDFQPPVFFVAKCTGAAVNAEEEDKGDCEYPVFPGVTQQWNQATSCWDNGIDVWLIDLNAGSLTDGHRYLCMVIRSPYAVIGGDAEDERMLATVVGSGGSSGPGQTIRFVTKVCQITP